MIDWSPVTDKIIELFNASGVKYELIKHDPVYTSEEAAEIRGTDINTGAKALVFYADKTPMLFVVPGSKRLNLKDVKKQLEIKDLRMARPEQVLELTGLEIGSIPPIGKALGLKSIYDSEIGKKEKVSFNVGAHTVSIITSGEGLLAVEEPEILEIA